MFVEGKKENYHYQAGNLALMLILGEVLCQVGWIVPLVIHCKKQYAVKEWLYHDFFSDWQERGVIISYVAPSKHNNGSLGVTLPSEYVLQPMQVIHASVVSCYPASVDCAVVSNQVVPMDVPKFEA